MRVGNYLFCYFLFVFSVHLNVYCKSSCTRSLVSELQCLLAWAFPQGKTLWESYRALMEEEDYCGWTWRFIVPPTCLLSGLCFLIYGNITSNALGWDVPALFLPNTESMLKWILPSLSCFLLVLDAAMKAEHSRHWMLWNHQLILPCQGVFLHLQPCVRNPGLRNLAIIAYGKALWKQAWPLTCGLCDKFTVI